MKILFAWMIGAGLCLPLGQAAPRLASPFTDHAVMQREQRVPVWGSADAGEEIEVELGAVRGKGVADARGHWRVELPPQAAGGPFVLKVKGKETREVRDVWLGEVWVCSGQSNMDFTVAKTEKRPWSGTLDAEKEIAAAKFPMIRSFSAELTLAAEPKDQVAGSWKVCSPETVGEFSAVAYFFARKLHQELKVPVGIVTCAYGASTAEAWVSRDMLETRPEFQKLLDSYDRKRAEFAANAEAMTRYEQAMVKWKEASEAAKSQGKKVPRAPAHPDPVQDQHQPTVLFNGMVSPIIPYAVRGAIWYQGESNQGDVPLYGPLQKALVEDWRARWGQDHFAFHAVLLAGYKEPKPEPGESRIASFREMQATLLECPETGIASAVDVGEEKDVHPRNKQVVGARLADSALGLTYGKRIQYDRPWPSSGPMFQDAVREGAALRLRFRHVHGGLVAKGGVLKGFSISGAGGKPVWADARIEGDTVVVSHPTVSEPVEVRYAWADLPDTATLYNVAGFPAVPFRSGHAISFSHPKRSRPAVYLVGDSTVKNGGTNLLGWGDPVKAWFDYSQVEVFNRALGGRSSRSYLREGLWQEVRDELQAGDLVLIQMGHNDGGPYDSERARASIPGVGEETKEVVIQESGNPETVRSYGWYLRRYVREAKAAGAIPVICSLVPRNLWKDGKVQRAEASYAGWARQVAASEGVTFLDLNQRIAEAYDQLGQERVGREYFRPDDHTHTIEAGARFNASIVAKSLREANLPFWSGVVKGEVSP